MKSDTIPVEYEGKALPLGPLTADLREAFCQALKPRYIREAWELLQSVRGDREMEKIAAANLQAARQEVCAGGLYWSAQPSAAVAAALMTKWGVRTLTRLQLDEAAVTWTDDEVDAFLEAKDPPRDEGNLTDYQVAMDCFWETADPKARRGSAPSAGPAGTGASSLGSPPATSACPAPTPAA
jgi:hypothetical protein